MSLGLRRLGKYGCENGYFLEHNCGGEEPNFFYTCLFTAIALFVTQR
jgi:hypothetical protein